MQLLVQSEDKKNLMISAMNNLERYMHKTGKSCGLSDEEKALFAELESSDIIVREKLRPNERPGRFKEHDRVVHLDYGAGTVLKNASNEYAECYDIKYDNGYGRGISSEGLLTFE